MQTIMDLCFLCTKDYNCVFVDSKIVSQVEYLLPEITIFKLGVPLRICSVCDGALYAFNKFKQFYVESSRRLEASIKGAQGPPLHTDGGLDYTTTQLHKDVISNIEIQTLQNQEESTNNSVKDGASAHVNTGETSVDQIEKIEEIFIKEEQLDEPPEETNINMFENILKQEDADIRAENDIDTQNEVWEENFSGSELEMIKSNSSKSVKDFSCEVCDKSFTQKVYLDNHMIIHSEVKDFVCSICNKTFRTKKKMNQHKKVHSGIKKHQCNICNKSFRQKHDYEIHLKIHSGINDFPCSICTKAFPSLGRLNQHMKHHSEVKDFRCDICSKSFSHKYNFKVHMKSHMGVKDFSCDVCNKCFTLKHHLDNHMRTHSEIKK